MSATSTRPGNRAGGGRRRPRRAIVALAVMVASVAAAGASGVGASPTTATQTATQTAAPSALNTQTAAPSALKPIDPAALQALVERRIQELHVPGAVVLLRTPQGEFTDAAGTTELGLETTPGIDTHF